MRYTLTEIKNILQTKIIKAEELSYSKEMLSHEQFLIEDCIDMALDAEYFKGKTSAYREVLTMLKSVITD